MSSERRLDAAVGRWIGVAIVLPAVVGILWLAATGRLELYVHPRYTVFTVVLALVGGAASVLAVVLGRGAATATDEDGHEHPDAPPAPRSRARGLLTASRILIVVLAAAAVIVLPPRALTAHTAQNRTLQSQPSSLTTTPTLVGASTSSFTVKDWAALLRTGDSDAVTGRAAKVTAYVLPIPGDSDDFYAARLLVTCCAVDAQPVAIPVHLTGWRGKLRANDWVELSGTFQENPDATSPIPTVLVPETVKKVAEPAKPYVY